MDVDRLIEDLDKAFAKQRVLTTLAKNLKLLKPERERCKEKKSKNRRLNASNTDEKELALYLDPQDESLLNFVNEIQQIDSVDDETLLLFTSKTDKACLRDLFDSHCFMGEAEKQVHDFCFTQDQLN